MKNSVGRGFNFRFSMYEMITNRGKFRTLSKISEKQINVAEEYNQNHCGQRI